MGSMGWVGIRFHYRRAFQWRKEARSCLTLGFTAVSSAFTWLIQPTLGSRVLKQADAMHSSCRQQISLSKSMSMEEKGEILPGLGGYDSSKLLHKARVTRLRNPVSKHAVGRYCLCRQQIWSSNSILMEYRSDIWTDLVDPAPKKHIHVAYPTNAAEPSP